MIDSTPFWMIRGLLLVPCGARSAPDWRRSASRAVSAHMLFVPVGGIAVTVGLGSPLQSLLSGSKDPIGYRVEPPAIRVRKNRMCVHRVPPMSDVLGG